MNVYTAEIKIQLEHSFIENYVRLPNVNWNVNFHLNRNEHLFWDKNFHVFKHLNAAKNCQDKCDVPSFKTLDRGNTYSQIKIRESILNS